MFRACMKNNLNKNTPGEVTLDEFESALGHGKIAFRNYQHQQVRPVSELVPVMQGQVA